MAVIRISEEGAALDLPALIAQVRAGAEVVIEAGNRPVAVLRPPDGNPPHRTISEAIRLSEARGSGVTLDDAFGVPANPKGWTTTEALRRSEARGSQVTLDDDFGDDMEEIMRFNRQERPDPWASSWIQAFRLRRSGCE